MKTLILTSLCVLVAAAAAQAGPATSIIAPVPVVNNGFTGPLIDPAALGGQWFIDQPTRTTQTVRPYEFYDSDLTTVISGWVSTITYAAGAGTNITAFDISATVTNNLVQAGQFIGGGNSHNEMLTPIPYAGPMHDTKITAEFAIADLQTIPANWPAGSPYFNDPSGAYFIQATNEDELAWYCWSPLPQAPVPAGNYYVPTWDLGNIPVGQSAAVTMNFSVTGAGMLPADARYNILVVSNANQLDVLWNRTNSLKVSDWIDTIDIDPNPQIGGPATSSNASVFFTPEPATLSGLVLGGLVLIRRRRK